MITADANIYISAIQFRGNPEQLLHKAIEGDIQIAISAPILNEVLRVLRYKFGRSESELAKIDAFIRGCTHMVTPAQTVDVVKEDPDDNRIVECAIASGSSIIVSGDKDLLRLGEVQGIRIMKVSDFLMRGT